MVATVKRSVSLDRDLDEELSRRFSSGARSRFLNDAARDALARIRLLELLDRMDAEEGPIPQEIVDEVEALPRPQ